MDDQLERNDLEIEYTEVVDDTAIAATIVYESVTFDQARVLISQYGKVKRFTWR